MTRVAFMFDDNLWLGGITYLRNLLSAVRDLPERRIEPVLIVPREKVAATPDGFGTLEQIGTSLAEPSHLLWRSRRALQRYAGRDFVLERFLRRNGIALLSHSGILGKFSSVATLAWYPDFQHLHLTRLFSAPDLRQRHRTVSEYCRHATTLLLSSETARRDLASVQPRCAQSAEVLRFVANVPPIGEVATPAELSQRYGFSAPFFHLPNQFWAHKNHRVVLDALAQAKSRGETMLVLATGTTNDYRQPDHFNALMHHAAELGVEKMFRPLGVVPQRDLMGLMAASVAVINPSLFEGWSTTVEEAKSMGKRVILSDIPTHREQAPARGAYFPPDDAAALSQAMSGALSQWDEADDRRSIEAASAQLTARRRAFGRSYEDIALRTIARRSGAPEPTPTEADVRYSADIRKSQ